MDFVLGLFYKIRYLFLVVVISIVIALLISSGGVNLNIWFISVVFLVIFFTLWALHAGLHKLNRYSIRVALFAESVVLFIVSLLMGGNDQSFGVSDAYSVTFLGKTYAPDDPLHDRMIFIVDSITVIWAMTLLAILITVFVSLFFENEKERDKRISTLPVSDQKRVLVKEKVLAFNLIHVGVAFASFVVMLASFPKAQDPHRIFIDKGFILLGLWLLLTTSAILLLARSQPLRYPPLMYSYLSIGIFASLYADSLTRDLYGVAFSVDVTIAKVIVIVVCIAIPVMFARSALFSYNQQ